MFNDSLLNDIIAKSFIIQWIHALLSSDELFMDDKSKDVNLDVISYRRRQSYWKHTPTKINQHYVRTYSPQKKIR